MSNYNFNGNITGNYHHFGDINNYKSIDEFVSKNANLKFTDADIELFNLIFENVQNEDEKWQIIKSLKSIKAGDTEEKSSSSNVLKFFLTGFKKIASAVTYKLITNKILDFLSKNNAYDMWQSITN